MVTNRMKWIDPLLVLTSSKTLMLPAASFGEVLKTIGLNWDRKVLHGPPTPIQSKSVGSTTQRSPVVLPEASAEECEVLFARYSW